MKLKLLLMNAAVAAMAFFAVGCEKTPDEPGTKPETYPYQVYTKAELITGSEATINLTAPKNEEGKSAEKAYYTVVESSKVADIIKMTDVTKQLAAVADYAKKNGELVTLPFSVAKTGLTAETEYIVAAVAYDEATQKLVSEGVFSKFTTKEAGLGELVITENELWSYGYRYTISTLDPTIQRIITIRASLEPKDAEKNVQVTKIQEIWKIEDTAERDAKLEELLWSSSAAGGGGFYPYIGDKVMKMPQVIEIKNETGAIVEGDRVLVIAMGVGADANEDIRPNPDGPGELNFPVGTKLTKLTYKLITTKKHPVDEADIDYGQATATLAIDAASIVADPAAPETGCSFDIIFTKGGGAETIKYMRSSYDQKLTDKGIYDLFTGATYSPNTFTGTTFKKNIPGAVGDNFFVWTAFDADGKAGVAGRQTINVKLPEKKTDLAMEIKITIDPAEDPVTPAAVKRAARDGSAGEALQYKQLRVTALKFGADVVKWTAFVGGKDKLDADMITNFGSAGKWPKTFVNKDVAEIATTDTRLSNGTAEVCIWVLAVDANEHNAVAQKLIFKSTDTEISTMLDPNAATCAVVNPSTEGTFNVVAEKFGEAVTHWRAVVVAEDATDDAIIAANGYAAAADKFNTSSEMKYDKVVLSVPEGSTSCKVAILTYNGTTTTVVDKLTAKKLTLASILGATTELIEPEAGDYGAFSYIMKANVTFTTGFKSIHVYATFKNEAANITSYSGMQSDSAAKKYDIVIKSVGATDTSAVVDFKCFASRYGSTQMTLIVVGERANGTMTTLSKFDYVTPAVQV